jgi:hypothetical protein
VAVQFDDEYLGGFAAPPLDDPHLTLSPSSLLHEGSLPGLGACPFLAEYATDRHRRMPGVEELANWVMSRKSLDEAMFLTLMQRDGETRNRLGSRVASLWTVLGDGLSIFQAIDYSAAMNPHVHAILWNCRHAAPFIEDAWLRVLRVPDRMTRYAQARPLRGVGGVYYCAIRAVGYADWDVIGPGWGGRSPWLFEERRPHRPHRQVAWPAEERHPRGTVVAMVHALRGSAPARRHRPPRSRSAVAVQQAHSGACCA